MCAHFHQDVGLPGFTKDKIIGNAAGSLTSEQRTVVREFLDELLNGSHDAAEIKQVWQDSSADIYFPKEGQLVKFLNEVRQALQ